MKYKTIAVIGLGQFGTTIAKMLASMNHEVLGVDINPEIVQKVSPYVTHAIVADTTDEEAIILFQIGNDPKVFGFDHSTPKKMIVPNRIRVAVPTNIILV